MDFFMRGGFMFRRTTIFGIAIAGAIGFAAEGTFAQSAHDWTGFYAGGAVGYGFFDAKDRPPFGNGGPDPDGVMGTAFVGANFQTDQFVLGVEADISGGDLKESRDWLTPLEINYVGTLRGRAGFSMGDMLLYATGGFAYSRMTATHSIPTVSAREIFVGWTVGGGIDLQAGEKWFLRAEYLYTDLGTDRFNFPGIGHPHIVSVDGSMVRLGVGFQF